MVAELTPRLYLSTSALELMGVTVSIYSRITRPSMFSWRSGSFSMVFGVSTLEGRVLKPAEKLYSVDRRVSMQSGRPVNLVPENGHGSATGFHPAPALSHS